MGSQQNNANKRTVAWDKFQENMTVGVMRFDATLVSLDQDEIYLKSITFKSPTEERNAWFVVVRASVGEGACVGFHSAETFGEALKGTLDRLVNRSLKWKDDAYA